MQNSCKINPNLIHHFSILFLLHDFLPDTWIEGGYLGKNYSSLDSLLNVFNIEEKQQVVIFLKHIDARNMAKINKELERKRKSAESKKA